MPSIGHSEQASDITSSMRRSARISTLARERAVTPENPAATTTRSGRKAEQLSEPSTPVGRTVDIWYDLWSTKSLQDAIEERTGSHPGPLDRSCCVQRLVELDQEWTFHRFWDLPKELRFLIYANCLELRPSKTSGLLTCYPNILQTSSGIHKVAQPMLYTTNTFEIKIKSTAYPAEVDHPLNISTIEFNKLEHAIETLKDAHIEDIDDIWPDLFFKITSIRLILRLVQGEIRYEEADEAEDEVQEAAGRDVDKGLDTDDDDEDDDDEADYSDYEGADRDADDGEADADEEEIKQAVAEDEEEDVTPDNFTQLNHILHSLMALPMLKSLHIVLKKCPDYVSGELLHSILYPVSMLAHNRGARLTFEDVPDPVRTSLEESREVMRKHASHHILLRKLQVEFDRGYNVCSKFAARGRDNGIVRLLANALRDANDCLKVTWSTYIDSSHYDRCNAVLAALRSCLDSAALRDLEAKSREKKAIAESSS